MTIDADDARLTPEEAFSVLGDGTRMTILRTLWDADGPLGFSELNRRVGASDSGRFNYHLSKLVGHFVRQVDDDNTLTNTGFGTVQVVIAGTTNREPSFGPVEVDAASPIYDAPMTVMYEDDWLYVRCTRCEGSWGDRDRPQGAVLKHYLPPAGVRDRAPKRCSTSTSR